MMCSRDAALFYSDDDNELNEKLVSRYDDVSIEVYVITNMLPFQLLRGMRISSQEIAECYLEAAKNV